MINMNEQSQAFLYILGIGLTNDQITDPRRRSDYSNPFTNLGP